MERDRKDLFAWMELRRGLRGVAGCGRGASHHPLVARGAARVQHLVVQEPRVHHASEQVQGSHVVQERVVGRGGALAAAAAGYGDGA